MDEYEVMVAGSGVAGLTAALFAARYGRSVLVLGMMPGGALLGITKIDDFPGFPDGIGGHDLGPLLQEQAQKAGADFDTAELAKLEQVPDSWIATTSDGGQIAARTVILATGTNPGLLHVPGEDRLSAHGISHCASCDGPLLAGKTVAVVGGGDSALQESLELVQFVDRVLLIDKNAALTGQAAYREQVERSGKIEHCPLTVVEEILGEERVEGLRLRNVKSATETRVGVSALFVFVGGHARTSFLEGLSVTDGQGHVETDAQMRTAAPGLFAAGSIRTGFTGQAVTAAGDGAAAAVTAHAMLSR